MRTKAEITHAFTPVGKLNSTQTMKMNKIAIAFKSLALDVEDLVPETADRTSALRHLMLAKFECVQAITHEKQPIVKAADPVPVVQAPPRPSVIEIEADKMMKGMNHEKPSISEEQ